MPAPPRRVAMGRRPSRDERALWRAATRDAVPLAESNAAAAPPAAVEAKPKPKQPARAMLRAAVTPDAPALPELSHAASPGLDRRNAERLKRGQRPIEARLDLHGMIQDE